ncbi:MAG: ubiquinol-cytochrome c reductase iron-sulfur subunit [Candidatus Eremiobacteraeota bacterium]|nr:ubiquinol-cytochrome c reductase iron-sulfur subunit [Candidatus Eremiobacteraeota bacterium]
MGDDLSRQITRVTLVATIVAAICATVAAANHAPPAVVGWLGAATFFGIALATGATARGLHAPDNLREPREAHGPSEPVALPSDVTRRGVFEQIWGVTLGAFALLAVVPFVALARRSAPAGTAWRAGARLVTPEGKPVHVDDLAIGGVETVFPEGNRNAPSAATLLIRLPTNTAATDRERSDWVQSGNIAYSKICTHAGCPVAIYREQSLELYCPCHQSVFDVVHSGRPISGPATRSLPQLALDVDARGYLIARGDFSAPVGPDSWSRTL